jgi:hypothetical protein
VCQSQSRFVAAAGIKSPSNVLYKYASAYDAEKSYGCKCDAGYRGPDCAQGERWWEGAGRGGKGRPAAATDPRTSAAAPRC